MQNYANTKPHILGGKSSISDANRPQVSPYEKKISYNYCINFEHIGHLVPNIVMDRIK